MIWSSTIWRDLECNNSSLAGITCSWCRNIWLTNAITHNMSLLGQLLAILWPGRARCVQTDRVKAQQECVNFASERARPQRTVRRIGPRRPRACHEFIIMPALRALAATTTARPLRWAETWACCARFSSPKSKRTGGCQGRQDGEGPDKFRLASAKLDWRSKSSLDNGPTGARNLKVSSLIETRRKSCCPWLMLPPFIQQVRIINSLFN